MLIAEVTFPTTEVLLNIWDHGTALVPDRQMGVVRVPLQPLMDGDAHESWQLIELEEFLQSARKDPRRDSDYYTTKAAPKLRICARFAFSSMGEFSANFLEPPAPRVPPKEPEFSKQVLIHNIGRVVGYLSPIGTAAAGLVAVLNWEKPLNSAIVTVIYIWVCFHLEYLPAMVCASFLVFVLWQFVKKQAKEASIASLHAVSTSIRDDLASPIDGIQVTFQDFKEHDEEQNNDSGNLHSLIDMVCPHSLKDVLGTAQNKCGDVAGYGDTVMALLHWESPKATAGLCGALAVMTLVCIFFPLRYLVLIGGSLLFFSSTGPFAALVWILTGCARYFANRPKKM